MFNFLETWNWKLCEFCFFSHDSMILKCQISKSVFSVLADGRAQVCLCWHFTVVQTNFASTGEFLNF